MGIPNKWSAQSTWSIKFFNDNPLNLLKKIHDSNFISYFQNISPKTLGKLVLDAVERSVDSLTGEIQVFKFLNHLYHSARDYERMSAESMIHIALQAVEAHSQTLSQIEVITRPQNPLSNNNNNMQSESTN